MILRLMAQTASWLATTAALLFIPASTLHWPGAWIMLAEMATLAVVLGIWLRANDMRLLEERLGSVIQREQRTSDRFLMGMIVVLWTGWFVLMGLDVGRNGISQITVWLQVLGALGIAVCGAVTLLTFKENTYAAPVVKIQETRGQTTITTGPYARVRHPMYAGAIPYFIGTPLLLGSLWGLALAPLIITVLALRAVIEERVLYTELAGYAEYATHVPYRLIPFVW